MAKRRSEQRLIYHYTGLREIRSILRVGVLRAEPMILWKGLLTFGDPSSIQRRTQPIVWFTLDDRVEMTVYLKHLGNDPKPHGKLFRVSVPYGYAGDLGLGEYSDFVGIPGEDWRWVVLTGEMAGSDCGYWRIVPHDVPREDWAGVEVLGGLKRGAPTWVPIDASGATIPDAENPKPIAHPDGRKIDPGN